MGIIETLSLNILGSVIAERITKHFPSRGKNKGVSWIPLDELQQEKIEKLIKIGYISLLLDEIPNCGNWGLTINRYIEINYPNTNDILLQR